MIRKLLATTAIATLVATGAFAQATTTQEPATTPPAAGTQTDAAAPEAPAQKVEIEGHLASKLIGMRVYNSTSPDAENIGEVKDIIIGKDGKAQQVVVGVGGFLGIGDKDVALDYAKLEWAQRDGDMWLVAEGQTKEQLEAQPEFDTAAYDPTAQAEGDVATTEPAATSPATGGTAATTPPADSTAEAPAASSDTTAATEPPAADKPADTAATEEPADKPADTAATSQPATGTDTATADKPADQQMAAGEQPAAGSTDETTTGAIDRSQLKPWDTSTVSGEDLIGTAVYGANDERLGEIGDVVLSQEGDQKGKVDAIVVDVGGFLGIGEKKVAIGMDKLEFMQDEDGNKYLYTNFSKEQLEAQPAYDEATYVEKRNEQRMTVQ